MSRLSEIIRQNEDRIVASAVAAAAEAARVPAGADRPETVRAVLRAVCAFLDSGQVENATASNVAAAADTAPDSPGEDAARLRQEMQEFTFAASHDLQEPLRKILAFGRRLEAKWGANLDSQGRDYLARMLAAAERGQALLEGLLQLSRVTSHGGDFVAVDLNATAESIAAEFAQRLAALGARLSVQPLPQIEGDPPQMRMLMGHLVDNALKFRRPGVPPEVRVFSPPAPRCRRGYEIVVEDNGIGFEEKYGERIFSVFQRLHPRDVYPGIGMGLAICRKIVQRHGGRIAAESTPGQGSRFVVTLPASRRG